MESEFGYALDLFGTAGGNSVINLLDANLQILMYLQQELKVTNASQTFRTYFGMAAPNNPMQLKLGYEGIPIPSKGIDTIDALEGYTPYLPKPDSDTMYLGSAVSVSTIVHEFGHQLDRYFLANKTDALNTKDVLNTKTFLDPGALTGFARENYDMGDDHKEYFADYFMTAVLAGQTDTGGKPYQASRGERGVDDASHDVAWNPTYISGFKNPSTGQDWPESDRFNSELAKYLR